MFKLTPGGWSIIRPLFDGHIMQSEVTGIEHILTAINQAVITDIRHAAYMLATVFHETGEAMQPVRESGRGKGYDYGKKLKRSRKAYDNPDFIYYGRGHVQITWFENYEYLGKLAGVDLLNNPDLMLDADISAKVMIIGMTKGAFTGVKLSTYFNDTKTDPVNARKIINGSDKDELIAKYYRVFYKALGGE